MENLKGHKDYAVFNDEEQRSDQPKLSASQNEDQLGFSQNEDFNILFSPVSGLINQVIGIVVDEKKVLQNKDLYCIYPSIFHPDKFLKNINLNESDKEHILENLKSFFRQSAYRIGLLKLIFTVLCLGPAIFIDLLTNSIRAYSEMKDILEDGGKTLDHSGILVDLKVCIIVNAVCIILIMFASALNNNEYQWQVNRLQIKVQTYLQNILYRSYMKRKSFLTNQSTSNINNLITNDINTIINFFINFYETISLIVRLIIAFIILYNQLKEAIVVGLFVTSILIIINFFIARKMSLRYQDMMKYRDSRISITSALLESIRQVKLLRWESIFFQDIMEERGKEFQNLTSAKYIDAFVVLVWSCCSVVISSFTLGYFYHQNISLKGVNVMTTIFLFILIITPLNKLPSTISAIMMSRISYNRYLQFLAENIEEDQTFGQIERLQKERFSRAALALGQVLNSSPQKQTVMPLVYLENAQFVWSMKNETAPDIPGHAGSATIVQLNETPNNQKSKKEEFILQIDHLQLERGKIIAIVGVTGSGQSALLLSLLGELYMRKADSCVVSQKVSYAPQKVWLRNLSVKENVIDFGINDGSQDVKKRFDWSIQSSELYKDINELFQKREHHKVGPDGCQISGGQQQRTAIARALYRDSDLYLMDDVFSSVDPQVAGQIFTNAFLALKSMNKTVVFTTTELKYAKLADELVLIKNDQVITNKFEIEQYLIDLKKEMRNMDQNQQSSRSEQSPLPMNVQQMQNSLNSHADEHPSSGAVYSNRMSSQIEEYEPFEVKKFNFDLIQIQNIDEEMIESQRASILHQNSQIQKEEQNIVNRKKSIFNESPAKEVDKKPALIINEQEGQQQIGSNEKIGDINEQEDDEEDDRLQGGFTLNSVIVYIKFIGGFWMTIIIISLFGLQISTNLYDTWIKDEGSGKPMFRISQSFLVTLTVLAAVNVSMCLLRSYGYAAGNLKAARRIFQQLLTNVMLSPINFFEVNPVGRIINRFSSDTQAIDNSIPFETSVFFKNLFLMMGPMIVITIQIPEMVAMILVIFVFIYFLVKDYRIVNREIKRLDSSNNSSFLNYLSESIKGSQVVRAFKAEQQFNQSFQDFQINNLCSTYSLNALTCWISLRLQFLPLFLMISICSFLILSLYDQFELIESNSLELCLMYSVLLTGTLTDLTYYMMLSERDLISVERVNQYFQNKPEFQEKKLIYSQENQSQLPHYSNNNNQININSTMNYQSKEMIIELENVSLSYNQGRTLALDRISLTIRKGEKIALCGRTGSGKSSILSILFRLYEINSGIVRIDGKDISQLPLDELREKIAVVPQSPFIFEGTVQQNIDPFKRYEQRFLREKLALFSQNLTLETNLKNGGENLSFGEQQIISFVRAILSGSSIICLDQAVSNIDINIEGLFYKYLFEVKHEFNVVLISHQLESLKHFDKIYVLAHGKIVEQGTYETLVKNSSGTFTALLNQQKQQ